MNNAQQKQVVDYLIQSSATKLLSNSPLKGRIATEARTAYNQMRAKYSEGDVAGVDMIERILSGLIWKLVRCTNTDALEQAISYVEALERGEVLVAKEDKLLTQQGEVYAPPSVATATYTINADEWLTIKRYAQRYGISTQMVTNWITRGIIPTDCVMTLPEFNGLRLVRNQTYSKPATNG